MKKFDGSYMTGKTEKDCETINKYADDENTMTVDNAGHVYNEAGNYIADYTETERGDGLFC